MVAGKHIFILLSPPNTSRSITDDGCASKLTTGAAVVIKDPHRCRGTRRSPNINALYLRKSIRRPNFPRILQRQSCNVTHLPCSPILGGANSELTSYDWSTESMKRVQKWEMCSSGGHSVDHMVRICTSRYSEEKEAQQQADKLKVAH